MENGILGMLKARSSLMSVFFLLHTLFCFLKIWLKSRIYYSRKKKFLVTWLTNILQINFFEYITNIKWYKCRQMYAYFISRKMKAELYFFIKNEKKNIYIYINKMKRNGKAQVLIIIIIFIKISGNNKRILIFIY